MDKYHYKRNVFFPTYQIQSNKEMHIQLFKFVCLWYENTYSANQYDPNA